MSGYEASVCKRSSKATGFLSNFLPFDELAVASSQAFPFSSVPHASTWVTFLVLAYQPSMPAVFMPLFLQCTILLRHNYCWLYSKAGHFCSDVRETVIRISLEGNLMYCHVIMKCQLIMTGFKCGSILRVTDEHISHFFHFFTRLESKENVLFQRHRWTKYSRLLTQSKMRISSWNFL